MLPFDAPEASVYADLLTEDEMDESWQWLDTDGTRHTKTTASLRLIETIPSMGWVARGIRALRLAWLVGLVNEVFSRIRVRAGKLVPDVERTVRWP